MEDVSVVCAEYGDGTLALIFIPSRSVDKRHAVLTYDGYEEKFRVKDLSSVNGTYVNDARLAEQEYVTLEDMDTIRFGYDPVVYRMERIDELPHLEQQEEMVKVTPSPVKVNVSPPRSLVTSAAELPTWAVREPSPRPWDSAELALAECQGCIVEQGIRHTCGGSEDAYDHYPVLQPQPQPDHSCSNGHTGAPPCPPNPASHNRWKDSRLQHQHHNHQDAIYRHNQQQTVYTSGSVDYSGAAYRREQNYQSSAHVQFAGGASVTSPSSCQGDFTSGEPSHGCVGSRIDSRGCDGQNSDGWSSETRSSDGRSSETSDSRSPPTPGQTVGDEGVVLPMVDEHELAASQQVNRHGEGNVGTTPPTAGLTAAGLTATPGLVRPPHDHQATNCKRSPSPPLPHENFQTHFQIIPPRQGQNYRIINVQFKGPNLAELSPPADSASQPDSAASSGYHSLKASLSHFVFVTPSMEDGMPVLATPEEHRPTLAHLAQTKGEGSATSLLAHLAQNQREERPTRLSSSSAPQSERLTFSRLTPTPDGNGDVPDLLHPVHRLVHDHQPVHEQRKPVHEQRKPVHEQQKQVHEQPCPVQSAPPEVDAGMGAGDEVRWESEVGGDCPVTRMVTHVVTSSNNVTSMKTYCETNGTSGVSSPKSPAASPLSTRRHQRRSLAGTEPELETLQKCTPLYGQPAWWGEQEHVQSECAAPSTAVPPYGSNNVTDNNEKKANGTERPHSLALSAGSKKQMACVDMNKYKTDPRYATTYMEIPQRDISPGPPSPGPTLPHTQPQKGPSCSPPIEKAVGPMAFTVDLGDEMGEAPKLNMKKSLSEFLPHKVRRSFRSRSVKSRNKSGDEKEDSPASGNSGKGSRDGSPASRTSRTDQASNLYHSDGGHNSGLSSDNEDLSIRSDTVTTKISCSGAPRLSLDIYPLMFTEQDVPPPPPMFSYVHSDYMAELHNQFSNLARRRSAASPRAAAASRRPCRDQSAGCTSGVARADLRKQQPSATSTGEGTNYLIERMFNQSMAPEPPDPPCVLDMKVSSPLEDTSRQAAPRRPGVLLTTRQRDTSLCEPVDNVSESGTYTIEGEAQGTELKRARQSIDAVFGVTDRLENDTIEGDIKDAQAAINGATMTLDKAALLENAANKQGCDVMDVIATDNCDIMNDMADISDRSDITTDADPEEEDPEDYKIVEVLFAGVWASPKLTRCTPEVHSYQPEAVVDKDDTPVWVSQWATLATQKTFVKSPTLTTHATPTLVSYRESTDVQSSSESGVSVRKPRGTGRRLPAVPTVRQSSSTTPLSPHSTTAASSELCSTWESTFSEVVSTVSETLERDVDDTLPHSKPTAYIDPRPPEIAPAEHDDVQEMLKNSGVTSDVVTFVYDEMADSMQTQMSESMTSSRMTKGMLEEELTDQPEEVTTCSGMESTNHRQEFLQSQQVSRQEDEEELRELSVHYRHHSLGTARSGATIDTEVLLKDTADAVRAMADRVKVNNEQQQNKTNELWNRKSTELFIPLHDDESDSEGSSRCLNGRGEMPKFKPKPKLFKSHSTDQRKAPPKPFLSREQREKECEPTKEYKDTPRPTASSRASSKSKTSSVKPRTSHPPQTTPKIPKDATFVKAQESSVGGRSNKQRVTSLDLNSSFGSDLHSESETGSILSTSTDYSESLSPKLGRSGSKGKGPMTMTRPNRAFALRRARLEGDPEPLSPRSQTNKPRSQTNTPRSETNTPRSQTNTPRLRCSSAGARDPPRSRPTSARDGSRSERTDPSLGVKTVHRNITGSRESSVGPPRAKSAGPRTDMGRFTARHVEKKPSVSSTVPRKSMGPPSASRNKSDRISVSNMTVLGTRSKPTSQSNSPQTLSKTHCEEYSAWKRRKTYDPRQAVVNAKAKAKEQKNKPLPEWSLTAGPHSRNSTFSSVSSEDTSYMEELAAYGHDRDAISQVSSTVSHQMDAMSRSIESDDAFIDNKLGSSGRQVNLWADRSTRSAFSAPRSSKSVPLTRLRAPPPPSSRRQSAGRLNSTSLSNGTNARLSERAQKISALPLPRLESYDSVMVNSIYQLSLKVRTQTSKLIEKMRNEHQMTGSPSPTDDGCVPALDTDLPGYKNANQELVGILRNLCSTERHLQLIDRTLFPVKEGAAVSPATSPHNHKHYLRELERIRTEISGFRPIGEPASLVSSSCSSWRRTSHESDCTDIDAGDPLASDEYY